MSETMNEAEPIIEAVEVYPNNIYKIKYIVCYANTDEDDDAYIGSNNKVSVVEITEKPIITCKCDDTEWDSVRQWRNVNTSTSCCSKSFIEYVEKQIEDNNTGFPTIIPVEFSAVWIILEIIKIN